MSPLMVSSSGVRGIIGPDFHPLVVATWTAAFSEHSAAGPIVVGRDSRPSGKRFARIAGDILQACGRSVWDLGIVPTPTVQIAVEEWHAAGGVILTASHNPAEWNACKFVGPDGTFLSPEEIESLRHSLDVPPTGFAPYERWGSRSDRGEEAIILHRDKVLSVVGRTPVRGRSIRVLLDCVHGAAGVLLPSLLRDLGASIEVEHEEAHGRFPRAPEPTGPALLALAEEAGRRGADLALAVDPDADRCAVAVPGTDIVGEEWTLPLVASFLLQQRKGTVVTNLSTSTRLEAVAEPLGCRVERSPVGESHVVKRMRTVGAVLGGEGNGGVIDPQVHLGRDAAVAAAWLVTAHASVPGGLAEVASHIPPRYVRKGRLPLPEAGGISTVRRRFEPLLGEPDDCRDGLRWTREGGFVHVRPSGTEPILRVIVEGPSSDGTDALFDNLLSVASRKEGR